MKIRMMLVMFCIMAVSPAAFAQYSVKLFDELYATDSQLADDTTYLNAIEFGTTKQVYLRCIGEAETASLSGPLESTFLVDNFVRIEAPGGVTSNVCPSYQTLGCFTPAGIDTTQHTNEPVTTSLNPIAPLDISSVLTAGSGVYTFKLMDFSVTYGNTEVWLNTSCRIVSQICHRNNGSSGQKTLNVGASAVPAHLAHGDTLGPCTE